MIFNLATVAWAAAAVSYIVAMIAGFDAAVRAALLAMMFACGVQLGSLMAGLRKRKRGDR